MIEGQGPKETGTRRMYEQPKLVQYGDLTSLTNGFHHPGEGPNNHFPKLIGPGDDLGCFLPGSPFTVVPK